MLGGHRRKFYAIAGVALAVAAPPRAGSGGVTVVLPVGWHSTTPDQGSITNPVTRVVVSSGPIHTRLTGRCHTQVTDYAFPDTAVVIVVLEWTKAIGGMRIGTGPARPRHFTAANLRVSQPMIECFSGPGGSAQWAERHHSFGAYVLLGRRASASLAARARAVLDTIHIARR